ncbi:MAG: glycosyltransferase family 2 protein [Candidatus Diapherotrites archaeon]|nr:glycosyltransferase family 2 protein [Candidatus Diapherotrites archaeon]
MQENARSQGREREKEVSVVIPLYNEERNVEALLAELNEVLQKSFKEWEVLAVDDGSHDTSFELLVHAQKKYPELRIVKFKRNYGQTAAMNAGFKLSRGKVVVAMDADLQNDPADIPKLVKEIARFDVVSGWRFNRKDSAFKRLWSRISNGLAARLTGVDIHDFGCTLKAYKLETVKDLQLFGQMHRYLPALLAAQGYSVGEMKVNHRERANGMSKYNWKRLFNGVLDLVFIKFWTDYSKRPLHFFGGIGIAFLLASLLIAVYKVVIQLMVRHIPLEAGPLLLLSIMLFITGVLLLMFGFLSEIQVRMYYALKNRENYEIEKIY